MINVAGLAIELAAAGIAFGGCHSDGRVWDANNVEIQNRPEVAAIIAVHNAAAWEQREQRILERQTAALADARLATQLRNITQAQFTQWCDTNLMTDVQIDGTSLSAAIKQNLKANNLFTRNAGRMLIALRDKVLAEAPE